MRKFFLFIVVLLTAGCGSADNTSEDREEIIACYKSYKKALMDSDGEKALQLVTSNTIEAYEDILGIAVYYDSVQLSSLKFIYIVITAQVRCQIEKEALLKMNGEDLFVYAVENDFFDKEAIKEGKLTIGEIQINRNIAEAHMDYNGEKSPLTFKFYREADKWKFDIMSFIGFVDFYIQQQLKESGISEKGMIDLLLLLENGDQAPENDIWSPIIYEIENGNSTFINDLIKNSSTGE